MRLTWFYRSLRESTENANESSAHGIGTDVAPRSLQLADEGDSGEEQTED